MNNRSIQVFKPLIREESIKAVSEVLSSGWIGLGPKTKEFEDDFAKFVGSNYAVALNSCTSALHLALLLTNVKPGQIVFTTPLTFVSTNLAIEYIGARPVFVDVLSDGNMSPESLREKLKEYAPEQLGAIMVVHFAGYPANLEALSGLSAEYNVPMIEDCAHACGAIYRGNRIGNSGICCFSFQAVKNLPIGDGGMLTFNAPNMLERAHRLRWCGIDKSTFSRSAPTGEYLWHYDVPEIGFKYHMNDISAAIGIEQLKYLEQDNARRASIAARYRMELGNIAGIEFPTHDDDRISSYHFLPARVRDRDRVLHELRARGIHCGVHYRLNSRYAPFKDDLKNCPDALILENELLTLPIHLLLTDEEIGYVIDVVKEIFKTSASLV